MKWLNRDLMTGPYVVLVLTEKDYHRVLKHCKVPRTQWSEWVPAGSDGKVHVLENGAKRTCIVCIRAPEDKDRLEIYGLLVHEAAHVWQEHCEAISDNNPSREAEAYAIQAISQRLMYAYDELTKEKTPCA